MATGLITAVLFDFGDTLFAHVSLAETVVACAARLGHPLTVGAAAGVAAAIERMAADPSENAHPRDLDAEVWSSRWRTFYALADDRYPGLGESIFASMHSPAEWRPFRCAAEVLAGLRQRNVRVGVVSNTGWDVRGPFAAAGLLGYVDVFTLSCEVGWAKPDVRIFAAACAALGVEADHVLMVGDNARTDGGGRAAGLRTLLLPVVVANGDNGLRSVIDLVDG